MSNTITEEIRQFLLQLSWQESFAFFPIGVGNFPLLQSLQTALSEQCRLQIKAMQQLHPAITEPVSDLMEAILQQDSSGKHHTVCWLELHDNPGVPEADAQRASVLRRLNVERGRLENHLHGPLIITFPLEYLALIPAIAPDLWSFRMSVLRLPPAQQGNSANADPIALPASPPAALPERLQDRVTRWLEQTATIKDPMQLTPREGFELCDLLTEWYAPQAAEVAQATHALAQARLPAHKDRSTALRDLSVSLDNIGNIACVQGDLPHALTAFEESLQIRRDLLVLLPGQPALRDLSIALDNVGNVARDQGDLPRALAAFEESLQICSSLAGIKEYNLLYYSYDWHPSIHDTQKLRSLSISLENIGDITYKQGNLEHAYTTFVKLVSIFRALCNLHPLMPEAWRNLSRSLNKLSKISRDQKDFSRARSTFEESLQISRKLREQNPNQPQALHDLSISLKEIGDIAIDQGDELGALTAFEELLYIQRTNYNSYSVIPGPPQALRDLSTTLDNIGDAARHINPPRAFDAYKESLQIRRELCDLQPLQPQSLRDLSVSLEKVGYVARDQGNLSRALAAFEESLQICRDLRDLLPDQPQALRDLSIALNNVGNVARDQGDLLRTLTAVEESLQISQERLVKFGDSLEGLYDLAFMHYQLSLVTKNHAQEQHQSEARAILQRLRAALPDAAQTKSLEQLLTQTQPISQNPPSLSTP